MLFTWLLFAYLFVTTAVAAGPFNCHYDIDMYNCVNINCKGQKRLTKIPQTLSQLINIDKGKLKTGQLLCSIDLSETGIEIIDRYSIENINEIYSELIAYNIEHANNVIKVSLSNIKQIESFKLTNTNIVLFIRDSVIKGAVEPKSLRLSSHKIDLNLINVTLNANGWLNLLDSTSFHNLFTMRNIPNLNSLFDETQSSRLFPITTITDLKVYNSYMPLLDENCFFMLKILKYVEQIEISNCSISQIKEKLFNKITFSYLRSLSLANNRLTRINAFTFAGLNELVMLDLDDNPIEIIEMGAFDSLKKLKSFSMNNNLKLINLMRHFEFNSWFNPFILRETNLNELSLKSSVWSEEFCLIQDIILRLNKNSISTNTNNSTPVIMNSGEIDDFLNVMPATNNRKLNLFNEDQIENLINNENYCNLKFICVNLKNLYWRLDVFNLCIKLKMRKQPSIDCVYYRMSYECSLSSESDTSKYEQKSASVNNTNSKQPNAEQDCLSPSRVYTKIKLISFIIISVIILLILLTLVFFYYSFKNSQALVYGDPFKNHHHHRNRLHSHYQKQHLLSNKKNQTIKSTSTNTNSSSSRSSVNSTKFSSSDLDSSATDKHYATVHNHNRNTNTNEYYVLLFNKNQMN